MRVASFFIQYLNMVCADTADRGERGGREGVI